MSIKNFKKLLPMLEENPNINYIEYGHNHNGASTRTDLTGASRPHLPRYQYDPELLAKFTENARPALLDFVQQQNRWGGDPDRSVDDISERIRSQELQAYAVPEDMYGQIRGDTGGLSSGGFHSGNQIYMKGTGGSGGIAHELGHELYGHRGGSDSVPKMNWYNKLDRKLKGWLPSFSKYAERPRLTSIENTPRRESAYMNFSDRTGYNERMKSGDYNPKFADAPFDHLSNAMWNLQDQPTRDAMLSKVLRTVKTKGGDYGKYDKRSLKAKDFRYAFKEAREQGLDQFDWDGRKYSTKLG